MTAQDAQKLVAAWRVLWPSAPWRAEDMRLVLSMWAAVMSDIEYSEAEAVIVSMSRDGRTFPPSPGEIVQAVLDLRDVRDGTAAPGIDLAMAEVQHYVRTRGERRGPPDAWSHPAVAAAVRAIGWHALCSSDSPDTTRAHFMRAYESARGRITAERRMTPAMAALLGPSRHTPELTSGP